MTRLGIGAALLFFISPSLWAADVAPRFDAANSIVEDHHFGRTWTQDDNGVQFSWQSALQHCEALELGAFTDWRLPNVLELSSLVQSSRAGTSIARIFAISPGAVLWTATTAHDEPTQAYGIEPDGSISLFAKELAIATALCVREP